MRICIDLRMPAPSSRFLRPDDDDAAIVFLNCDNRIPGKVSFPLGNSVLCLLFSRVRNLDKHCVPVRAPSHVSKIRRQQVLLWNARPIGF